jgi:hypothetical protein
MRIIMAGIIKALARIITYRQTSSRVRWWNGKQKPQLPGKSVVLATDWQSRLRIR